MNTEKENSACPLSWVEHVAGFLLLPDFQHLGGSRDA